MHGPSAPPPPTTAQRPENQATPLRLSEMLDTSQGKIERFWQTLAKHLRTQQAASLTQLQHVLDTFRDGVFPVLWTRDYPAMS